MNIIYINIKKNTSLHQLNTFDNTLHQYIYKPIHFYFIKLITIAIHEYFKESIDNTSLQHCIKTLIHHYINELIHQFINIYNSSLHHYRTK